MVVCDNPPGQLRSTPFSAPVGPFGGHRGRQGGFQGEQLLRGRRVCRHPHRLRDGRVRAAVQHLPGDLLTPAQLPPPGRRGPRGQADGRPASQPRPAGAGGRPLSLPPPSPPP